MKLKIYLVKIGIFKHFKIVIFTVISKYSVVRKVGH